MPLWAVTCPECNHTFTHAVIEAATMEQAYLDPFGVLPRPKIPKDDDKEIRPNCKTESVFQAHDLFYREDARGQSS
jgi:hypothetical protein